MKILVTGATGFVGKRLIFALLEDGHEVYALSRIQGTKVFAEDRPGLYHIFGDLHDPETVRQFPKNIDAAYYLVHSMSEIVGDLAKTETECAENFIYGLKKSACKQIIYLGGIINDEKTLSPHLASRLVVERVLQESGIATTILRASVIIGAGSASFEIIRDLTEKLPIMIAPKWLLSKCQPIAIQDVLYYLTKVLLNQECYSMIFDIGGPEVFTFKQLLLEYASFRNLKRLIITVPVLTPRLSSLWLVFITSVRFSICFYLIESLKSDSVVKRDEIHKILPHSTLTFKKALELTFQHIAQNEVVSTWMDSWEVRESHPSINKYIQVPVEGCLKNEIRQDVRDSREKAIDRIWRIGGDTGYYGLEWAWRLRGFIDKMIGGVGLNRGRRSPTELLVGDSVDFWRVLRQDKQEGTLILYAEMKLPGEAWLEFRLEPTATGGCQLIQTATFRPKGLFGRLYWYTMLPFHYFIFRNMAKAIAGATHAL